MKERVSTPGEGAADGGAAVVALEHGEHAVRVGAGSGERACCLHARQRYVLD
jgi:hypothetical protein